MKKEFILDRYFNGNKASKATYGIILITVMLIGLHHTNQGIISILQTLFFGGLTIVFAEIYSEILGETIKNRGSLAKQEKTDIRRDTFVISTVSLYPICIFIFAYLNIITENIAFKISFGGLLLGLTFFGYVAAFVSGKTRGHAVLRGFFTGLIGFFIILLKYFFSH